MNAHGSRSRSSRYVQIIKWSRRGCRICRCGTGKIEIQCSPGYRIISRLTFDIQYGVIRTAVAKKIVCKIYRTACHNEHRIRIAQVQHRSCVRFAPQAEVRRPPRLNITHLVRPSRGRPYLAHVQRPRSFHRNDRCS